MDRQSEHRDEGRRLRLPSGKQIDVVVFGAPVASGATVAAQAREGELHRCRDCACDLVHPTDWEEVDTDSWRLALRCPNCEWLGEGVYDRETVEALDEQLEDGMEHIVCDLRRLTHANMEEHIDRFVAALQDDLIVPFDF